MQRGTWREASNLFKLALASVDLGAPSLRSMGLGSASVFNRGVASNFGPLGRDAVACQRVWGHP